MTPELETARTQVRPSTIHEPSGYAHAVRVGNTLYVSGQVPRDQRGETVGVGDFETQCRQVYANLRAVLQAAGGDLSNAIKVTTLLVRAADFETWRAIRSEVFSEPYPASTLMVVAGLSHPEYLVEVEMVALLDD